MPTSNSIHLQGIDLQKPFPFCHGLLSSFRLPQKLYYALKSNQRQKNTFNQAEVLNIFKLKWLILKCCDINKQQETYIRKPTDFQVLHFLAMNYNA